MANATTTIPAITADTKVAQAAKAKLLEAIRKLEGKGIQVTTKQDGSKNNQRIEFKVNGQTVFTHYVRNAGYFVPLTTPKLTTLGEAIHELCLSKGWLHEIPA